MTRRKHKLPNKIRNVKLVLENDDGYVDYITNLKLEKYHLRLSNQRSCADLIAKPLEQTVREWAKMADVTVDQRIISYEILKGNRYEKRYNEIDVVFRLKNKLFLVEVKVSSSKKAVPKASNQLINAREILRCARIDVEMMVVHINLNYKNAKSEFYEFSEDFLEIEFSKLGVEELGYYYMQLKPHQIFEWGVERGIIFNPELLPNAIKESDYLHLNRMKRQELTEKEVPKDEWPDDLIYKLKFEDIDKTYFKSFGVSSSSTLLSEKLRSALNPLDGVP